MLRGTCAGALLLIMTCAVAGAGVFLGPDARFTSMDIVRNPRFDRGGASYASEWRPLPGRFRMHRLRTKTGDQALFLQLREAGDGGVIQTVDLPPERDLSLQMLATCWGIEECAVVATVTRVEDGEVLTEIMIDGVERGVMAQNLFTGEGGRAEVMLRLVGERGARSLIDWISFGPSVDAWEEARGPVFTGEDLILAPGEGLRVDADFAPELLPQAAQMLQEALEDLTGRSTRDIGAVVSVAVDEPQATDWPARESYRLTVDPEGVRIDAPAEGGAFRGMMTVIDLLRPEPDGGARIVAVDVEDAPALPWRIGSDHDLHVRDSFEHGALRTARLKLNMAVVDHDPPGTGIDDDAAIALLRATGVEPMVEIEDTVSERREAAFKRFRELHGVTHFAIEAPWDREGRPDWTDPLLATAREMAPEIVVIVPAFGELSTRYSGAERFVPLSVAEMERWPQGVVACLLPDTHSEDAARQLAAAEANEVRYVIFDAPELDGTRAALRARQESENCLGVIIVGERDFMRQAADLAWRGQR